MSLSLKLSSCPLSCLGVRLSTSQLISVSHGDRMAGRIRRAAAKPGHVSTTSFTPFELPGQVEAPSPATAPSLPAQSPVMGLLGSAPSLASPAMAQSKLQLPATSSFHKLNLSALDHADPDVYAMVWRKLMEAHANNGVNGADNVAASGSSEGKKGGKKKKESDGTMPAAAAAAAVPTPSPASAHFSQRSVAPPPRPGTGAQHHHGQHHAHAHPRPDQFKTFF